jgi:hypothetical protein
LHNISAWISNFEILLQNNEEFVSKCSNLYRKNHNIGFQENRNFFAENCDYNIDPSSVAGIVLICPILMSLKLAKHEFLHFTHFPCVPLISHYGIGRHNMYVCTYIVDTIHNLTWL